MKTLLKTFICLLLLFAFSCGGGEKKSNESMDEAAPEPLEEAVDEGTTDMNFEVEDAYKCPMDCEEGKEYDEEGACPVCGMSLKHVDEEAHDDSDGHHKEDEDHEDHEEEGKTDKDFSDE
ncbi:MAG: hypothetical protein HKO92_09280 [Flavobacteriaceae bacterium]|nr:hypothetical protein [Flavobacteriaceae bacterium]